MQLQKATRKQVKMRLGLSAVSGGGKTYSALLLAHGLCGDWNKIAVIDTENDSASLYSHLGPFSTLSLKPDFSPERYIEAIKTCEKAGIEVCIIDSIAHEWEGEGGVLDLCDRIGGGFQNAWKQMTPRHDKFKQAILQSPMHMITTVRRKQEYILTEVTNKQGKLVQAPVKAGMKEITREGWEYELTINFEIDLRHMCSVSKDRTELFEGKDPFIITEATGELIKKWCDQGVDIKDQFSKQLSDAIAGLESCSTENELKMYKKTLASEVIKHPDFVKAGKARYETIMATVVQ